MAPALCQRCAGSFASARSMISQTGRGNVRSTLVQRHCRLLENSANSVVNTAVFTEIESQTAGQQTVRRHTDSVDV